MVFHSFLLCIPRVSKNIQHTERIERGLQSYPELDLSNLLTKKRVKHIVIPHCIAPRPEVQTKACISSV